ncbi:hypothetical protein GGR55DRAFT_675020 [Xylaria sp. FL0064]|nr:hypothetical protein GGR55DRAFT_675020 [Xylaria sp. FL0064]
MAVPLEKLLEHAATEVAERYDGDFVLAEHLPYTIQDTKDPLGGFKTLLACFYHAVQAQNWSIIKIWCNTLRHWDTLEFDIPCIVRATLTAILYSLASAPGMPSVMDDLICSTW